MNETSVESEQYVQILTDTFRIEGNISIFTGVRLTDYMNELKSLKLEMEHTFEEEMEVISTQVMADLDSI